MHNFVDFLDLLYRSRARLCCLCLLRARHFRKSIERGLGMPELTHDLVAERKVLRSWTKRSSSMLGFGNLAKTKPAHDFRKLTQGSGR